MKRRELKKGSQPVSMLSLTLGSEIHTPEVDILRPASRRASLTLARDKEIVSRACAPGAHIGLNFGLEP